MGDLLVNRLERLYAVAEEVRRRSPTLVSAADLAKRFEVSRRTMERDLLALREAGVPIYASRGRSGGYATVGGSGRLVLTFTAKEATGLVMAARAGESAPYSEAALAAVQRLTEALPEPTRVAVDELRSKIRTTPSGRQTHDRRVVRAVEEAVRTGHTVNMTYTDNDGVQTRRAVDAVGFFGGTGAWFLIGWCHLRRDRRLFRLDRITSATVTKQTFQPRDVDETLGWIPDDVEPLT